MAVKSSMNPSVKPVILCLSAGGESVAKTLAKSHGFAIHGRSGRVKTADVFFDNTLEHIASLFCAGTPIIGLCAAGILIRAVAPHLRDKKTEPAIIAISEDGKSVIPLLGGHHGGNNLAREIAADLNGHAGITTAGDIAFGVALDEPPTGWRLGNPHDAAGFMANILSVRDAGVAVDFQVETDEIKTWLAPLLNPTAPHLKTNLKITCTDKPMMGDESHLIFHPQNLALGLGCIRGADADEIWDLITDTLRTNNLSPFCIACVGSLDVKADEAALNAIAIKLNIPYRVFSAVECETQKHRLTSPSKTVFAEVGCHSVSEASAILIANGELIVPKQKSINATCALAKSPKPITEINGRKRGQLALIGIGPGQAEWRTPEASRLIAQADELVGYGFYIDLLGAAARGRTHKPFPLGAEEDRCRYALEQAGLGKNIALICSGDSGIYAMGALVFELLDCDKTLSPAAKRVEVLSAPGISALQAAAARIGAPLGHDFCAISLSDLLTPRADIINRLRTAALGDFVIALYNPVSKTRTELLNTARETLLEHRPKATPVLIARALGRAEESLRIVNLGDLQTKDVDMMCLVLIGAKNTKALQTGDGRVRLYTPRGYAAKNKNTTAEKKGN